MGGDPCGVLCCDLRSSALDRTHPLLNHRRVFAGIHDLARSQHLRELTRQLLGQLWTPVKGRRGVLQRGNPRFARLENRDGTEFPLDAYLAGLRGPDEPSAPSA